MHKPRELSLSNERSRLVELAQEMREFFMNDKLNEEVEKNQATTNPESLENTLTIDAVNDALKNASKSANELNKQLKDVFGLPDSSATLRLR